MLEFAKLVENASLLSEKLGRCNTKTRSYFGFFSAFVSPLISNNLEKKEAETILLVANNLVSANDTSLLTWIEENKGESWTSTELTDFKLKVLVGAYLLVWTHCEQAFSSYLSNQLLTLLREDLNIYSLEQLKTEFIEQSFNALSVYCSLLFSKPTDPQYQGLYKHLGDDIQVDISKAIVATTNRSSSFGCFTGVLCW